MRSGGRRRRREEEGMGWKWRKGAELAEEIDFIFVWVYWGNGILRGYL